MKTYALIENGVVTNRVIWDGNSESWTPPEGATAVEIPEGVFVDIGYGFDGMEFFAPPEPEVPGNNP